MKRLRLPRRARLSPAVEDLIQLASEYGLSSCRLEDRFWEDRLAHQVDQILAAGDDEPLQQALDHLYQTRDRGYEGLADLVESRAETAQHGGQDILLIAIPVLAWSRFSIPSGPLGRSQLETIKVQLQAHVLADGARLALADFLFSPDQLPNGFAETARFTSRLAKAAVHGKDLHIDPGQVPAAIHFLSDTRYLLGAVAVPTDGPLFVWQSAYGSRLEALQRWVSQGGEALRPALTGCAIEPLQPLAFFAACRESDRQGRAYAIRASVAFLTTTLNLGSDQLRAVVAPFHQDQLEEYRVGFTSLREPQVLHGLVWPLLDAEDEQADIPAQIEAVLREAGIGDVVILEQAFPMEYCDDCGVPLYPNADGEPMHAELPEDQAERVPRHLH